MAKAIVFDIKRFAVDDGPGIRTTVFFKGCPLRCVWCHSPESIKREPELVFYEKRCIRCGRCVEACPESAQEMKSDGERVIDRGRCTNCGKCCEVCGPQALEMKGREYTTQQLFAEIQKDSVFYQESGGGVTFSGGEPTIQFNFLMGVLEKCKKESIHTALDTSGFVKWQLLCEMANCVDLFLYDLKHIDNDKHIEYTGVSNELILDNLRKLVALGKDILVTVPLIPGYNDSEQNLKGIMDYVKELGLKKVIFMPYNKSGEAKYKWLGSDFELPHLKCMDAQLYRKIDGLAKARNLTVRIGR